MIIGEKENKILKVAILDNTVNGNYVRKYSRKEITVVSDYYNGEDTDISHGTLCSIVYNNFLRNIGECLDITIYFLSVYDFNGVQSLSKLYEALLWCYNSNIKIINLSIGLNDVSYCKNLHDIVSKLYNKGTIMIAACSNTNKITYPAAFKNVLGVRTNRYSGQSVVFRKPDMTGIDVEAVLPMNETKKATQTYAREYDLSANSLIVPYVSSLVTQCVYRGEDISTIPQVKACLVNNGFIDVSDNEKDAENKRDIIDFKQNLESLDVPIVAYVYLLDKERMICETLQNLLAEHEYSCALLSDYFVDHDWYRNRYHIHSDKNINLEITIFCNIVDVSIILVCISDKTKAKLVDDLIFDGVITSKKQRINTTSHLLQIDESKPEVEKQIMDWIINLFSER